MVDADLMLVLMLLGILPVKIESAELSEISGDLCINVFLNVIKCGTRLSRLLLGDLSSHAGLVARGSTDCDLL